MCETKDLLYKYTTKQTYEVLEVKKEIAKSYHKKHLILCISVVELSDRVQYVISHFNGLLWLGIYKNL